MFESDSYDPQVIYREVQDFNHPLIKILMAVIDVVCLGNIFMMYSFNKKLPTPKSGNDLGDIGFTIFAALMIIFMLVMNWFFIKLKLITEVRNDCIFIRLQPGFKRKIEYTDISNIETVGQSSFLRGGWGYHLGPGWRCYSAPGSSKTAIQIKLKNNLRIVLSSKESEMIVKMIVDTARAFGANLQR